jgi:hypothetical protein
MGSLAVNTAEMQALVPQAVDLIGCLDFIFCENSGKQGAGGLRTED